MFHIMAKVKNELKSEPSAIKTLDVVLRLEIHDAKKKKKKSCHKLKTSLYNSLGIV